MRIIFRFTCSNTLLTFCVINPLKHREYYFARVCARSDKAARRILDRQTCANSTAISLAVDLQKCQFLFDSYIHIHHVIQLEAGGNIKETVLAVIKVARASLSPPIVTRAGVVSGPESEKTADTSDRAKATKVDEVAADNTARYKGPMWVRSGA